MAQAARDKKKEFKDNQRNRLTLLLKRAKLSTQDNERLVEAFFDIKIEKTTVSKDITKGKEAPKEISTYEKFLEVLKSVKAPIEIN